MKYRKCAFEISIIGAMEKMRGVVYFLSSSFYIIFLLYMGQDYSQQYTHMFLKNKNKMKYRLIR
jgi:hypothetical protein